MKFIYLIFCFCIISSIIVFGKSVYNIEGILINSENLKAAYLYSYQNGYYKLIDTAKIINSSFKFELQPNAVRGIYKIRFTPFLLIENILFNFENIKFKVDLKNIGNSLDYIESNENKVLNSYFKYLDFEVNREKVFLYLLGFYRKEDKFYSQMNEEMKRLKSVNRETIQSLINDNNHLLASKYMQYDQLPYIEIKGDSKEDMQNLITHYWDNIDFKDTILLNFPFFVSKLDNFFTIFENDSLSREAQEEYFLVPAEILLEKSKQSSLINAFVANKILSDAIQFNLHDLYASVAQTIYENDYCINADKKEEINKKIIDISKVSVGKKAPDFKITDKLNLYSLTANFTLVVFWESECEYCFQKLRELSKIYKEDDNKNFEVVAISLDKDAMMFKKTLFERSYKWINFSDFKGWLSPIINDYCISSTPAMLLLDRDKKIIAKPVKIEHIINYLEKKSK